MKTVIIIVLSLAAFLSLLTFGGGYYMYRFAIVRDRRGRRQTNFWQEDIKRYDGTSDGDWKMICAGYNFIKSMNAERVYITSNDGLKLCGHVIENPARRGVFIMVHGYRSCGVYDFSCAARPVYDRGFSLLIIDQRAHGDSEGEQIGFGALERFDVVRWAEYADNRWANLPVVMDGVSMGAASVMMGAGVGYPPNVRAIIADCSYSTPGAICRKTLYDWFHLPPFPVYYGARFWTRILAHYDLDGVSSKESLAALGDGVAVLIAHGKADSFVPYQMSVENSGVFGERECFEFFTSEGAEHAMSFVRDTDSYLCAIERLFEKAGI